MGTVHRVTDEVWSRDLALKTPRAAEGSTPADAETAVREAQIWSDLGLHPHVVHCYFAAVLGDLPRVFVELVEGQTLAEAIGGGPGRRGPLYLGEAAAVQQRILDLAVQVAWGIEHAHSQKIVHQDIKPENVLVSADWTAKVTDFGIAGRARTPAPGISGSADTPVPPLVTDRTTTTQVTLGGFTRAFAAPEQLRSSNCRVSRAADIWSWALTVLVMYLGEVPWIDARGAPLALKSALRRRRHSDLPAIPKEVGELLGRCTQKAPGDRPRATEIAATMVACWETVAGRPYSRPKPEGAAQLADGLCNSAVTHGELGDLGRAEEQLLRALQAQPGHLFATYNLGLLRWRSGRWTAQEFFSQVETAAELSPDRQAGLELLKLVRQGVKLVPAPPREQVLSVAGDATCMASKRLQIGLCMVIGGTEGVVTLALRRTHGDTRPKVVRCPVAEFRVNAVALSDDGLLVAVGSGNTLGRHKNLVYDSDSARWGGNGWVRVIGNGPGGLMTTRHAADFKEQKGGLHLIRRLSRSECVTLFSCATDVISVAVDGAGKLVAALTAAGELSVWCAKSNARLLSTHVDRARSVLTLSEGPDTSWECTVAVGGGSKIVVWASGAGADPPSILTEAPDRRDGTCFAGSANLERMACAFSNGEIAIWERGSDTSASVITSGHSDAKQPTVNDLAFVYNGRHLASAGADGSVRLWEARTGRSVFVLSEGFASTPVAIADTGNGFMITCAKGEVVLCGPVPGQDPEEVITDTLRFFPAMPPPYEDAVAKEQGFSRAIDSFKEALDCEDLSTAISMARNARETLGSRPEDALHCLELDLLRKTRRIGLRSASDSVSPSTPEVASCAVAGDCLVLGTRTGSLHLWDQLGLRELAQTVAASRLVWHLVGGDLRFIVVGLDSVGEWSLEPLCETKSFAAPEGDQLSLSSPAWCPNRGVLAVNLRSRKKEFYGRFAVFGPQLGRVISGERKTVEAKPVTPLGLFPGQVVGGATSHDWLLVRTRDGFCRWDIATGDFGPSIASSKWQFLAGPSGDGSTLLFKEFGGKRIHFYDLVRETVTRSVDSDGVVAGALSWSGDWALTGHTDGQVRLNSRSSEVVFVVGHHENVTHVDFVDHELRCVSLGRGVVRVWRLDWDLVAPPVRQR